MSANDLQSLLRFLSQDAKVPLATAMSKVKELQKANLDSPERLSKVKADHLKSMFPDEKHAKHIVSAAKRVAKKRAAGDDSGPSPKKQRKESLFADAAVSPEDLEPSVALPTSSAPEAELAETVLLTNRAPLVLAFTVTLLKHTMPEQPVSSRLSLAQAYVSTTSRSRAVSLGLESGLSAEEEGYGDGQPVVKIMGKDLRVLRRWGYEWRHAGDSEPTAGAGNVDEKIADEAKQPDDANGSSVKHESGGKDEEPALWALDLEALKKSNVTGPIVAGAHSSAHSNLPIYTPHSARAYLLKSFDSPPADTATSPSATKKRSTASRVAEKEQNLGKLLHALDLLYDSWATILDPLELDKGTWSWYVKVRPSVEQGVAGWGGKNVLKLADILALRREPD